MSRATLPLRFRGSFRNTSGLGVLFVFMAALFGFGAWLAHEWLLALVAIAPIAFLAALPLLWVEIDDDLLVVKTWHRRVVFHWDEITRVTHSSHFGWPRDRDYSPSTYEIRSQRQVVMLNLLYFPPECCRILLDRFRAAKLIQR
jgi:hypothetical protein